MTQTGYTTLLSTHATRRFAACSPAELCIKPKSDCADFARRLAPT